MMRVLLTALAVLTCWSAAALADEAEDAKRYTACMPGVTKRLRNSVMDSTSSTEVAPGDGRKSNRSRIVIGA